MQLVQAIPVLFPQRSEGWHNARLGVVTASEVKKTFRLLTDALRAQIFREILEVKALTASVKNTQEFAELSEMDDDDLVAQMVELHPDYLIPESQERINYRKQKVAEIIYKMRVDEDKYVNSAMMWGTVSEDFSKTMYQLKTGQIIEEAFLMLHPTIRCGASADGLVLGRPVKTTFECKNLTPQGHLYNVMLDPSIVIKDYFDQIQMQMWLEDAEECVFTATDSRAPDGLKMYVEIIPRMEKRIKQIERSIVMFNDEVDRDIKELFAVADGYKKGGM